MTVNHDINLGTVMTVGMFIFVQTLAGVWWAATMNANMIATRNWQERQDERIAVLEDNTLDATRMLSMINAIMADRQGLTASEFMRRYDHGSGNQSRSGMGRRSVPSGNRPNSK